MFCLTLPRPEYYKIWMPALQRMGCIFPTKILEKFWSGEYSLRL